MPTSSRQFDQMAEDLEVMQGFLKDMQGDFDLIRNAQQQVIKRQRARADQVVGNRKRHDPEVEKELRNDAEFNYLSGQAYAYAMAIAYLTEVGP